MTAAIPAHRRRKSNGVNRLISAAIGSVLLLAGFRQRDPRRRAVPAMPSGRSDEQTNRKARYLWMEVAKLLYGAIGQHRVLSIAAGVTFFALLAIFPAIGALVSVYGIFADPVAIHTHLNELSSLLPGGA